MVKTEEEETGASISGAISLLCFSASLLRIYLMCSSASFSNPVEEAKSGNMVILSFTTATKILYDKSLLDVGAEVILA